MCCTCCCVGSRIYSAYRKGNSNVIVRGIGTLRTTTLVIALAAKNRPDGEQQATPSHSYQSPAAYSTSEYYPGTAHLQ